VADAYLAILADRGVDYLFANAGTDFAPLIESLAKAEISGGKFPKPVTVPHENVAVAMAHGYYLATGRPQAVMLHVTVGTANGICGILNASRDNVPVIFTAGRSPITEGDLPGARSIYIHWAQEMYDQGGMVRELVKWDYELRNSDQLETVVDRALTVAMSAPRGPIYLTLPREVLARNPGSFSFHSPSQQSAAAPSAPDPNAIEQAAAWLAAAENPLIIASSYGLQPGAVEALGALAEAHALPVVVYRPRALCLPTDHPMHAGFEPAALLKDADVVLTLDSDVPWIPNLHKLKPDAKVIQIAADPLYSDIPIRGFPCDLAIAADSLLAVKALAAAMAGIKAKANGAADARRKRVAESAAKGAEARKATLEKVKSGGPMQLPWVGHCLNQVIGKNDIVANESQVPLPFLRPNQPGGYFANSPAAGLGWCSGAALGLKLARRDKRVFAVMGDGSYMFGNPTPAHFVSASMELPLLTVILNNKMWGAVRKATLGLHPDGAASRMNRSPLTMIDPSPEYEKVVLACGGHG
jgi:acetolactate synthase-1/2/3 large subunit